MFKFSKKMKFGPTVYRLVETLDEVLALTAELGGDINAVATALDDFGTATFKNYKIEVW